jgi:hypothetical protein
MLDDVAALGYNNAFKSVMYSDTLEEHCEAHLSAKSS